MSQLELKIEENPSVTPKPADLRISTSFRDKSSQPNLPGSIINKYIINGIKRQRSISISKINSPRMPSLESSALLKKQIGNISQAPHHNRAISPIIRTTREKIQVPSDIFKTQNIVNNKLDSSQDLKRPGSGSDKKFKYQYHDTQDCIDYSQGIRKPTKYDQLSDSRLSDLQLHLKISPVSTINIKARKSQNYKLDPILMSDRNGQKTWNLGETVKNIFSSPKMNNSQEISNSTTKNCIRDVDTIASKFLENNAYCLGHENM